MMDLKEKIDAFSMLLKKSANNLGGTWIDESGEGHAEERDNILLEDVSGWLTPIKFPEVMRKNDAFACFAEWRDDGGEVIIDFVSIDNGGKRRIIKGVNRKGFVF